MKILKIEVLDKKIRKIKNNPFCIGIITIGDFYEKFFISLNTWSLNEYKKQWREGLERIKTHDSSCLVADISIRKRDVFMQIYYLYKIDNKIFVRYQMPYPKLFKKMSKGLPSFNINTCYQYVPSFKLKDNDGNTLETWEADLDGIIIE